MRTPKQIVLVAAFSFIVFFASAQQDPMYSMYMFNGLAINPAYAGSRERPAVLALYRHQWTGLEGAPKTAILTAHAPLLNNKIAIGGSLCSDNISIFNVITLNFDYAYRIHFKKNRGKLSFGMNVTVNNYRARWNELSLNDAIDPAFLSSDNSVISPNFGAGVYYYTDRFYAGVSVPHFLNMSLSDNFEHEATDLTARQWKHYFYTMGAVFNIGKNVKFKPSFLFKHVQNAPFEADLNAGFLFKEALWVGAGYRTGDAMNFITEYIFAKGVRIGYAYDYTLTELNDYSSGSHEIMIGYEFIRKETYLTPRRMSYF
ncbi:MAG: type IX secretion system membrane protein PorP/SprF [Chitinophagales bacterium]|nr:type IX secretion system membrane protein PorP/SprF [Chitinophagales bacterium]